MLQCGNSRSLIPCCGITCLLPQAILQSIRKTLFRWPQALTVKLRATFFVAIEFQFLFSVTVQLLRVVKGPFFSFKKKKVCSANLRYGGWYTRFLSTVFSKGYLKKCNLKTFINGGNTIINNSINVNDLI